MNFETWNEVLEYIGKNFTIDGVPLERFTCFRCTLKDKCSYAFDGYNIDGDCLAEK